MLEARSEYIVAGCRLPAFAKATAGKQVAGYNSLSPFKQKD
jgi:hypothetical protein